MKQILSARYFIVFLFMLILRHSLCQQNEQIEKSKQSPTISPNDSPKEEYMHEQQFKNQVQQQLNPWVAEQMKQNEQHLQVQPHESAIFVLGSNVTQLYRIPTNLAEARMIEVSVFEISKQGQLILPQNPSQDDYVQVVLYDDSQGISHQSFNVYLSRIIQIEYTSDYKYLKFRNNADHTNLVLLDIQDEQIALDIKVSDNEFALTNKKIQTIFEQSKNTEVNRQHLYKWQWGFYQKHQRHQTDMLGFTGAQLLVIIATSIVQMYCIKNLINDELII